MASVHPVVGRRRLRVNQPLNLGHRSLQVQLCIGRLLCRVCRGHPQLKDRDMLRSHNCSPLSTSPALQVAYRKVRVLISSKRLRTRMLDSGLLRKHPRQLRAARTQSWVQTPRHSIPICNGRHRRCRFQAIPTDGKRAPALRYKGKAPSSGLHRYTSHPLELSNCNRCSNPGSQQLSLRECLSNRRSRHLLVPFPMHRGKCSISLSGHHHPERY